MQHLMQLMFWLLQLPLTRRIHFPLPLPLTRAAGVVNCSQMGTLCKLIVAHEVGELSQVPCPYVYVCASAFHGAVIIMGNMLKYDNTRVSRLIKGS